DETARLQAEASRREQRLLEVLQELEEARSIVREGSPMEATLHDRVDEQAKMAVDLEARLEDVMEEAQGLEQPAAISRERALEEQRAVAEVASRAGALRLQVEAETKRREEAEVCLARAEEKLEASMAKLHELQKGLAGAMVRAEQAEQDAGKWARRAEEEEAGRLAKAREVALLAPKLEQSEADCKALATKLAEVESRVHELEGKSIGLEGQAKGAAASLEEERRKAEEARQLLGEAAEDRLLQGQGLANAQTELTCAQQKLAEMEVKLGSVQRELEGSRDELKNAQEDLSQARDQDLANMAVEVSQGHEKLAEALRALNAAQVRGGHLLAAAEEARVEAAGLREEAGMRELEIKTTRAEAAELQEGKDRALQEVEELSLKLERSEEEACLLRDLAERLSNDERNTSERLSTVEVELASTKDEVKAGREARSSLRRALDDTRKRLEASLASATDAAANAAEPQRELREREQAWGEKEAEAARLRHGLDAAAQGKHALATELEKSEVALLAVKDRVLAVEASLQDSQSELAVAQSELAVAQSELAVAQSELAVAQMAQRRAAEAEAALVTEKEERVSTVATAVTRAKAAEEEARGLWGRVEALSDEVVASTVKVGQLEGEVKEGAQAQAAIQTCARWLGRELHGLQCSIQETVARAEGEDPRGEGRGGKPVDELETGANTSRLEKE
ncbi:unnamed protein product, partial [Discosporangium mesarthrocarpum]